MQRLMASVVRGEETTETGVYSCLKDGGANVHICTQALLDEFIRKGYHWEETKEAQRIGTAEKGNHIPITGWVEVGGQIGRMAVCPAANESLISVIRGNAAQ